MRWPPRSPDLTPCDFFFWGFVKDTVFVPPLPANLLIFATVITAAVALIGRDMLTRVWNEMDYRIDVCRITKGGHIEHLGGEREREKEEKKKKKKERKKERKKET